MCLFGHQERACKDNQGISLARAKDKHAKAMVLSTNLSPTEIPTLILKLERDLAGETDDTTLSHGLGKWKHI